MQDKLVVFVTNSLWDEPRRGRHHFADALADENTVVWVNRPLARDEHGPPAGLEHVERGLHVLHVGRGLLSPRIDFRLNWNNAFRLRRLLAALAVGGFERGPDLIWIHDFKAIGFARRFRSTAKRLYFCNDYFGEYVYNRYESRLASEVDCVFGTAPGLADRLRRFNPNSHFMPHGVWLPGEVRAFNKAEHPRTAGYVGTLRRAVDIDFLHGILDETDLRLILAGPVTEATADKQKEFDELFGHPRVTYLGNVGREDMNRVIGDMDVCLLPYLCGIANKYQFAVKYFDYIAAGKPIAATPYFEWPEPYGKFVSIWNGENLREFFESVYSRWDEAHCHAARALADECTWNRRVEQVSEIIYGIPRH